MTNATQIKNTVEENYNNYDGELSLAEWVEMELDNMPEGFDCFFEKSWDELESDEQGERIDGIRDALGIRTITIKHTDGEFDLSTTETDYQAILKLAADTAVLEHGLDAADISQPEFDSAWME